MKKFLKFVLLTIFIITTVFFVSSVLDIGKVDFLTVTGKGRTRHVIAKSRRRPDSELVVGIWSETNGPDDAHLFNLKKTSTGLWTADITTDYLLHSGNARVATYSLNESYVTAETYVAEKDLRTPKLTAAPEAGGVEFVLSNVSLGYNVAKLTLSGINETFRMTRTADETWKYFLPADKLSENASYSAKVTVFSEDFEIAACSFTTGKLNDNASYDNRYAKVSSWKDSHGNTFKITSDNGLYIASCEGNVTDYYTNVKVSVYTETAGEDDLFSYYLLKNDTETLETEISLANVKHTGKAFARFTSGADNICEIEFEIDFVDYIKALSAYGEDSPIDFVQAAANLVRNNSIGYGHTWPATISCSGLVALSLTGCGYVDMVSFDPHGWGYLDINPIFVSVFLDELDCKEIRGTFSKKNYDKLEPGDILYNRSHVGIYLGDGQTIEARGDVNGLDSDGGGEVSIYNWKNGDAITFEKAYRIPGLN